MAEATPIRAPAALAPDAGSPEAVSAALGGQLESEGFAVVSEAIPAACADALLFQHFLARNMNTQLHSCCATRKCVTHCWPISELRARR